MPIRISGMNSGLDTDAIVKELVSAYSLKTEKYEKAKTKLEWKQEAWKSLNTKIYSFYTNVSNLRYSNAYNMKKTTVSDSTKATVTASSGAITGTQKLNVLSTAQTSYLTGAKLNSNDAKGITGSTKLKDLGCTVGSEIKITDSQGNELEKAKAIKITDTTTVSELVNSLRDSGLNASFDENNQRFFISAKESGANADFNLTATDSSTLSALGLNTAPTVEHQDIYAVFKDNLTDTQDNINALLDKYLAAKNKSEDQRDENDTKVLNETPSVIQELGDSIIDGTMTGTRDENVAKLAQEAADIANNLACKISGSDAEIRLNGALYTSSTNSFSINGLSITAQGVTGDGDNNAVSINTAVDAQGIYDKVKDFLTEYNTIINEMTKLYNADSAKDYEPLTSEEKEAMSDEEIEKWEGKIKDALLRRDGTLSNVMSGMMNSMAQSITLDDGTKLSLSSFGIQTLGFLNAAENEQNAYHIDGDEDDVNTSGKTDKLMQAIQNNTDQVCEFMQKLAKNLYSAIDTKMKSTTLSSAYKVYNDKEMDSQLRNYATLISKWEEKVADKEDYYYKQFSTMESALAKLQSETSSLSGLLGM